MKYNKWRFIFSNQKKKWLTPTEQPAQNDTRDRLLVPVDLNVTTNRGVLLVRVDGGRNDDEGKNVKGLR